MKKAPLTPSAGAPDAPEPNRQKGGVSVEMALVAPLLILVIVGGVHFGRVLMTRHKLSEATSYATRAAAVPLEAFASGMLRPKKSLLAVFGVTSHVDRVRPLTELSPCENCSFGPCQYRRAPYRRSRQAATSEVPLAGSELGPLSQDASYTVNVKALRRWSRERLTIENRDDGSVAAVFRYDGTTCTNMGRPLQFHYHVTLGRREDGYPILGQSCGPAPGDHGHTAMCRYISDRDELMAAIAAERPLQGRPLDDVVRWTRPSSPAGCYCEPESRQHKWGLVLETIHYALSRT